MDYNSNEDMVSHRLKSLILGGLLLALLICAAVVGALKWYQVTKGCIYDTPPLTSIHLSIDSNRSQVLLRLLKGFAEKNGFKYEVGIYTPNGEDFSIWMDRKDIRVIASRFFDPGQFVIGFYNNDCIHPTIADDVKGLVDELKTTLSEIPSVMIAEEK